MRFLVLITLGSLTVPAGSVGAQGARAAAALVPRPAAATRPVPATARATGAADLRRTIEEFDHYVGRGAVWGGVVGVLAGTGWAIAQSRQQDATLVGVGDFLVGPIIGGAYGVGAGMVVGLGWWGWDHARGHRRTSGIGTEFSSTRSRKS